MKKLLIASILSLTSALSLAAGAKVSLDHVELDRSNLDSLRNGTQIYMDYCMGCHSLEYARFNRVARDLEIPEDVFLSDYMNIEAGFGDLMENAMPEDQSKVWFGVAPPDLTLVAKLRGTDWLYSYLRGFYADDARPWGVNNVVFKDVGMPHVLIQKQGLCASAPVLGAHDGEEPGCAEYAVEGELTPEEYDEYAYDLVNFLDYMADPARPARESLGWMVLIFIAIFWFVSFLYTRELHKDVH